jgi:hypothetical protein
MTLEVGTMAASGLNEGGGSHAREGKNHVYPGDRVTVCVGPHPRGRASCRLLDGAFLARDIMQGAPRWLPWPLFFILFIGVALLAAAISLISSVCQRFRYRDPSCRFRE